MINVFNLLTQQWQIFSCPPAQAVVSAYEHDCKNGNTWDYKQGKEHPAFMESARCVFCGDFGAVKETGA
jgi:hypothetical protein